jgi:hypothetical protein|tara:strand:+ start:1012 stop:1143 length:132 start_codon:yes stop_codon:yes gene_type:complete
VGIVYDDESIGEFKMYAFNLYFACGIFIGTLGLMGLDYLPRKK